MSNENIASLIAQRAVLVGKLTHLACYPEYHDSLNVAIGAIDDLLLRVKETNPNGTE